MIEIFKRREREYRAPGEDGAAFGEHAVLQRLEGVAEGLLEGEDPGGVGGALDEGRRLQRVHHHHVEHVLRGALRVAQEEQVAHLQRRGGAHVVHRQRLLAGVARQDDAQREVQQARQPRAVEAGQLLPLLEHGAVERAPPAPEVQEAQQPLGARRQRSAHLLLFGRRARQRRRGRAQHPQRGGVHVPHRTPSSHPDKS